MCLCCVFVLVSVCLSVSDWCVYTWCAVGTWCAKDTWMWTAMSLTISSMSMIGWMRWSGLRRTFWKWGGAVWHHCMHVHTYVCCSNFTIVVLAFSKALYYCMDTHITHVITVCTWNVFLSKMSDFLVDNVFKTWVTCKECVFVAVTDFQG